MLQSVDTFHAFVYSLPDGPLGRLLFDNKPLRLMQQKDHFYRNICTWIVFVRCLKKLHHPKQR